MFDREGFPELPEDRDCSSDDAPNNSLKRPSGVELIERLQAQTALVSAARADRLETINLLMDRYTEMYPDPADAAACAENELMACLHLTRRAARTELSFAYDVGERLPQLLAALREGVLDEKRVRVITRETTDLDDNHASLICDEVLSEAGGLTTSQIKAWVRKLRINTDPNEAKTRFEQSVDQRDVFYELTEDGTATITATGLQPFAAAVVVDRINMIARDLRGSEETRTVAQIRSDTFVDLLWGKQPSKKGGAIDIRVDLTTLMGLDDNAVDLSGYGPVIADIGRKVSNRSLRDGSGEWRFTVTDDTGRSVTELTRRRPTQHDRRTVEARDLTCIFPGCRTPSTKSDLDHRIPWAKGGLTHPDQLVPLCRRDHTVRHKGWKHSRNRDGTHNWLSPLSMTYTTTRAP